MGGTFTGQLFSGGLASGQSSQAAATVKVKKALLSYSVSKTFNFKVKVGYAPLPDVDLFTDIASRFGDFGNVYNPFITADNTNPVSLL